MAMEDHVQDNMEMVERPLKYEQPKRGRMKKTKAVVWGRMIDYYCNL